MLMGSRSVLLGAVLGVLLTGLGCQSPPTVVTEQTQVLESASGTGLPETGENQMLQRDVILLDARPAFASTVSPIRQAQTLDWRDFTRRVAPRPNSMDADLFFHARRLARMGIGPDSKVLILGRGVEGEGEEGRLAWTLRYLGVREANFASIEAFRPQLQTYDSTPPKEAPIWKPIPQETLLETRSKLMNRVRTGNPFYLVELTAKDQSIPWPEKMQFGNAQRVKFNHADFLNLAQTNPQALKAQLPDANLEVVVIDPDGEMAGYGTTVLQNLGYTVSCACQGAPEYFFTAADRSR